MGKKINSEESIEKLPKIEMDFKAVAILRCRYRPFCQYAYWLLQKHSEGETLFKVNDLSRATGRTLNTTYRFFQDMVNLGYLNKTSYSEHYNLILNSDKPKLWELLPYIKKTLGIK